MTHLKALSQWQTMVSTKLPTLSGPQSTIVALWSFALVVTGWSGLTTVSALLAWLADQSFATVRERLRDWYRDADDKSGTQRREVVVATCFAPLLRWVVSLLPPTCTRLALAMDASTLGQRFTVLSISVVIRGSAIPVAWTVVRATQAGAWQPHWGALFAHLRGAVPPAWQVIVTADRGLYAKWLYAAIVGCGWHPFLRINRQGKYRRVGESTFRPLSQVVVQGGRGWAGRVTCFATKARQLDCTLLARWDHGHTDPWLIVTDLPAAQADVAWYGMRSWIEGGYKDVKRGGWHWEQTKMEDRTGRTGMVGDGRGDALGGECGLSGGGKRPPARADDLPATHIAHRTRAGTAQPRALSCFRRGRIILVATLLMGQPLPAAALIPEPWPKTLDTEIVSLPTAQPHCKAA